MATYSRPPTSPVIDAQRSSRWPIFLFVVVAVLAVGGGIAYDRYVANAPLVLTPTKPTEPATKSRPGQSTSPSQQQPRPGQGRPTQTSSGLPDWVPALTVLIPIAFVAVFVLIIVTFVRRTRRALTKQMGGTSPVAGGSVGHWSGGQHVGAGGGAPAGPWARQPGTAASTPVTHDVPASQPAKRRGSGFPLLPIVVGAIILDQAMFNGRYSREALNWIMKFIEGFSR